MGGRAGGIQDRLSWTKYGNVSTIYNVRRFGRWSMERCFPFMSRMASNSKAAVGTGAAASLASDRDRFVRAVESGTSAAISISSAVTYWGVSRSPLTEGAACSESSASTRTTRSGIVFRDGTLITTEHILSKCPTHRIPGRWMLRRGTSNNRDWGTRTSLQSRTPTCDSLHGKTDTLLLSTAYGKYREEGSAKMTSQLTHFLTFQAIAEAAILYIGPSTMGQTPTISTRLMKDADMATRQESLGPSECQT